MSLADYSTLGEGIIARRLIKNALALGWLVSVNDGEEWTVWHSTDPKQITNALASTGEDIVRFFAPASPRPVPIGGVLLVWGNEPDGSELIADHTDNDNIKALVAATERKTA